MSSPAVAPPDPRLVPTARTGSSLRAEIARRLEPSLPARLAHFGRIYPGSGRYICISGREKSRSFALYFFHHGADDWRVYPPCGVGPSIVYWSADVVAPRPSLQVVATARMPIVRTKKCRDRFARIAAHEIGSEQD